jgi:phosphoglycerate dehydrogenase-like enzyme
MAEWCLARIISHERKFDLSRADQFSKQWAASKEVLEYRYLSDLTLTILGCGEIGLCIARAAKAFGMRVVGYVRQEKQMLDPALDDTVACLTAALQQADYIVNVLPSTKETHGLLSLENLAVASRENGGKCPVFVNVGRGDVTDTKTLCAALDQQYLAAAILDVLEQEPLPPDNPLWTHPKVTVSPHISAMTRAQDVPKLVLENYRRYVDEQPLLYVVDWNKTY